MISDSREARSEGNLGKAIGWGFFYGLQPGYLVPIILTEVPGGERYHCGSYREQCISDFA